MADLRGQTSSVDGEVAVLEGYYSPSPANSPKDGGGGTFVWRSGTPQSADDGGINIVPAGGTGWWERQIAGQNTSVRWFGAKGDGTTDDRAAIQAACDYVAARVNVTSATGSMGATLYSGPWVFMPSGVYIVGRNPTTYKWPDLTDGHQVVYGISLAPSVCLIGDSQTIIKAKPADAANMAILQVAVSRNRVEGIQFISAKVGIQLMGVATRHPITGMGVISPGPIGGQDKDCSFVRCNFTDTKVAIWYDASYKTVGGAANVRGFQQHLVIENCRFQCPTFWWGSGDAVKFRNCYMGWNQAHGYETSADTDIVTGLALPLGAINSSGFISLDGCTIEQEEGSGFPARASFFVGNGAIHIINCHHGDGAACFIRQRTMANTYQGLGEDVQSLYHLADHIPAWIDVVNSLMTATQPNWLEVYEKWPRRIRVVNGDDLNATNALGMWVSDAIPKQALVQQSLTQAAPYDIEFGQKNSVFFCIRRSSEINRNVLVGTGVEDISHLFEQTYLRRSYEEIVHSAAIQDNLFSPDAYNVPVTPGAHDLVVGGFSGFINGPDDTSTGFTLRTFAANAAAAQIRIDSEDLISLGEGVYCFSIAFKADFSGFMDFGYIFNNNNYFTSSRRFVAVPVISFLTEAYKRYWFTVYMPPHVVNTLLNEIKADHNAHVVLTAGSVHGAADTADVISTADAKDTATRIALANALRTAFESHRVKTAGGVHGAADNSNAISAPVATDDASVLNLAIDLNAKYNAHRVLTAGAVHGAADNTNAVTSPDPAQSTNALLNEIKVDQNSHVVLTANGVHGIADSADIISTADATDTPTRIALANALRGAYESHRVKTAGGVHGAADNTNAVSVPTAIDDATALNLAIDLKAKYNAHRVLTAGGVHGVADVIDEVVAPNPATFDTFKFCVILYNIPNGGRWSFGLPALHRGRIPAVYTYPKGSTTAVTVPALPSDPTTANSQVEGQMRSVYYRSALPTSGVYLAGDIIYILRPSAGSAWGYICTTGGVAGSSAIFKELGFASGRQPDIGALTDSTTGTANDTVVDVGASFNRATLNNNFADLIAKINALRDRLRQYGLMA